MLWPDIGNVWIWVAGRRRAISSGSSQADPFPATSRCTGNGSPPLEVRSRCPSLVYASQPSLVSSTCFRAKSRLCGLTSLHTPPVGVGRSRVPSQYLTRSAPYPPTVDSASTAASIDGNVRSKDSTAGVFSQSVLRGRRSMSSITSAAMCSGYLAAYEMATRPPMLCPTRTILPGPVAIAAACTSSTISSTENSVGSPRFDSPCPRKSTATAGSALARQYSSVPRHVSRLDSRPWTSTVVGSTGFHTVVASRTLRSLALRAYSCPPANPAAPVMAAAATRRIILEAGRSSLKALVVQRAHCTRQHTNRLLPGSTALCCTSVEMEMPEATYGITEVILTRFSLR
eukprot:m.82127 g.82127  ORF g.82127 m.82127 type:complete len:343 (-) comp19537_c0_seq1:133-1161(-)